MPLHNPHSIVQVLSVTSFEKVSIYQLLTRDPCKTLVTLALNDLIYGTYNRTLVIHSMKNSLAIGVLVLGSLTWTAELGAADSTAPVQPRSVKKIVDDGHWNGVPALTQWRDEYWLAYRNATDHNLPTGDIVVSTSKDGDTWRELRRLNFLKDDRDPQFIATPERLFLYTYGDDHGNPRTSGSFVTYTDDGKTWSEPQPVYLSHFFLWGRPLAHGDRFYAAAHRGNASVQDRRCHLITSSDGIHWEKISTIRAGKGASETALHFAPDGRLTAFMRNIDRVNHLHGVILESLPPPLYAMGRRGRRVERA